jgi:hypothetical protein
LVPPPLIGETAASRPRSPFGPIRPAVADVTKTAQDGEPTEVHVHIGRIEVTALPAPAAPKRRERPARQSPPLADYLAKRRPS